MIYFNSEKKSPLLAFIKSEPTFLTGSLAVCLSAPVPAFTQEFRSGRQGEAGGFCLARRRGLGSTAVQNVANPLNTK